MFLYSRIGGKRRIKNRLKSLVSPDKGHSVRLSNLQERARIVSY